MFALRGVVIALSAFVMAYCALSFALVLTWEKLSPGQRFSASGRSNGLFALRMLPFLAAVLWTLVLIVPSFLIFEPRSIEEKIGSVPLALSLVGLALLIFGVGRGIWALHRASSIVAEWTRGAETFECGSAVTVLQTSAAAPAMIAAGIVHPRILLSDTALSVLSPNELQAALNHELAHVLRRDNLRKLLLRLIAFPGLNGLESAWRDAAEISADETAVSNPREALDLAAALIKLSRFSPLASPAELTAALVHSPASLVDARVQRLIAWQEKSGAPRKRSMRTAILAGAVMLVIFLLSYGSLLLRVHAVTEWLVR